MPGPCYPTVLAPQLMQYQEGELHTLLASRIKKRAIFLPILIGLSLAGSLVGAGLGGAGIGYSVQSSEHIKQELEQALEATALSLASLSWQITSLAQVTLQNRRALDLLTEEKGGTCLFLQEQCCYYVNESGLVEENIHKFQDVQSRVKAQDRPWASAPWWQSILYSVLAPVLGPLVILFLIVSLGPCLLRALVQQLENIVTRKATAKLLLLQQCQYQRLQPESQDITQDFVDA